MFTRLKNVISTPVATEDTEAQPVAASNGSDLQDVSSLSWDLRVQCFALCFLLSMICSFLGSPLLFAGKMSSFAVMVSLGSVISMVGTCFLSGPLKQLKRMFEPTRLVATLIYIAMIVLTLVAGLVLKNPVLAVIFIIGQYVAMAWYSLSYIPYGREMMSRCFGRCIEL